MNCLKSKYLAIMTPAQWDCWLTLQAEINSSSYCLRDWSVEENKYFEGCEDKLIALSNECPMCVVFGYNLDKEKERPCHLCDVEKFDEFGHYFCLFGVDHSERTDAAIAKLEVAGVWDE